MWNDTTLRDDDITEQLVQFLIVTDSELEMARDDTLLLVIASGIPSEFENLCSEVFEDCSEIDGSTSTDTLSVVSALQHTMNTTDGELKTSPGRTRSTLGVTRSGRGLSTGFTTDFTAFSFARHCWI